VSSSATMSIRSGCSAAIALGRRERATASTPFFLPVLFLVRRLDLGFFGFQGASASAVIDFGLVLRDFFGLVATSVFKMLYKIDINIQIEIV